MKKVNDNLKRIIVDFKKLTPEILGLLVDSILTVMMKIILLLLEMLKMNLLKLYKWILKILGTW